MGNVIVSYQLHKYEIDKYKKDKINKPPEKKQIINKTESNSKRFNTYINTMSIFKISR